MRVFVSVCLRLTDQSSRAQQDHEDDEGLEPAVLHDLVAGLSGSPPHQAQSSRCVHLAAAAVANAHCHMDQKDTHTNTHTMSFSMTG